MPKKKDDPQLEEVIPETGDEDLIDQACTQNQEIIEEASEEAAESAKKTSGSKQHADDAEKTKVPEPAKVSKQPTISTIDDLIGDIHQAPAKPKIHIPAELVPAKKKKVWTPSEPATKAEADAVAKVVGGVTPGMTKQEEWKGLPVSAVKAPKGLISGPAQGAMATDPQPFIFSLDTEFSASFELLKVYASPIQRSHALIGVEKLLPTCLYLWFDCFDGHAGNPTTKSIRVYMIKDYDEFACKDVKPHKMIDLPKNIQHVIFTCATAPQLDDLFFLEDWMPIKEQP